MRCFVFYRINKHYILLNNSGDKCLTASSEENNNMFFKFSDLEKFKEGGHLIRKNLMGEAKDILNGEHLYVVHGEYYISVLETKSVFFKFFGVALRGRLLNNSDNLSDLLISKFRENQKDILLKKIVTNKNHKIREVINFIKKQCFCNEFTVWSVDSENSLMIREYASFSEGMFYKYFDDNCGISAFCTSGENFESRPVNENYLYSDILLKKDIKSVSRLKIGFDNHKVILIVSLYSNLNDFYVGEPLLKQFSEIIKYKYYEVIDRESERLERTINSLLPDSSMQHNINSYLDSVCKIIANNFNYEACSVFLHDKEKNILNIAGTYDCEINSSNGLDVAYSLDADSLTVEVFKDQLTMVFLMGIEDHEKNSHTYDEKTELNADNWIGTPITNDNNERIGVLRVKNKYKKEDNKKKICAIKSIYAINLKSIAAFLSITIHLYNQQKIQQYNAARQKEYLRVLMHEIRTPISLISLAPRSIMFNIDKINLDEKISNKINRKLEDIRVLAERMKQLTMSHNLENIITNKNIRKLSLLQDIIIPNENFSRPYIRKMYNKKLLSNHDAGRGVYIVADQILLFMAISALIENAAKYSYPTSPEVYIDFSSSKGGLMTDIHVINYGLNIRGDEEMSIYLDGFRGQKAIESGIDGTGIGLYLCSEIMLQLGGGIRLHRNDKDKNRIEFVLSIPTH